MKLVDNQYVSTMAFQNEVKDMLGKPHDIFIGLRSLPSDSGAVFQVGFQSVEGEVYDIIVKQVYGMDLYDLYTKIFEPYHLNCPHTYGVLKHNNDNFLVMEYVKHAMFEARKEASYIRAIDWLIHKDQIIMENLSALQMPEYVFHQDIYNIDRWVNLVKIAAQSGIFPFLPMSYIPTLEGKKQSLERAIDKILHIGRLTLSHNDFKPDHTLLEKMGMSM